MAKKEKLMTIGQVAQASGVAATTLRYYEREGILAPTIRSETGYRLYDVQAVEQMQFIRSAQAAGFRLDDIRVLFNLNDQRGASCRVEVQRLIENRLTQVEEKMKELERVRGALRRALAQCRNSNGECAVLNELSRRNKKRR